MVRGREYLALCLVLVCWGCGGKGAPSGDPIKYGQGFYNEEKGRDYNWRWMGPEGVIKLLNTKRDMQLKIKGRTPNDVMPSLPTITVYLNGSQFDKFLSPKEVFEKQYVVPAAKLGLDEYTDLKITTSGTISPRDLDKKSGDGRKLGFQIQSLTWENK